MKTVNLTTLARRIQSEYPLPASLPPAREQASAVLVILFPRHGQPHVLLIQRSNHLRFHAGEISFPGGTYEEGDAGLLATALRETREELNLDISPEQVLGLLPEVKTLTGFNISPYITILNSRPEVRKNQSEVQEILEIPLAPLLSTHHREMGYPPEKQMVAYWYLQYRVWGATGKILHRLGNLVGLL